MYQVEYITVWGIQVKNVGMLMFKLIICIYRQHPSSASIVSIHRLAFPHIIFQVTPSL